ncbi:Protein of unknown function [Tangfeifania diversioriginum]|uniref:DUF3667 domain-containing protein n=1 Tax=Tangfeifania diversioriginum TaxID=1168035 RepID=A0A1M6F5N7_9BACT|nr:DUF3667 domain-containing protein [Tangfeifania diversioriginum]SHI92976.1 Protein of unknown function [Tangfeifania diversioriginum]
MDKKREEPAQNIECRNCGTRFSGHYCPMCGQSVKEVDQPFSIIFYDFLGNVFAFDTRFWKTFLNLIIRPGFLTKEFFAGHRVRYATPIRFFIFASFILFLLLQIHTGRGLNSALNSPVKGGGSVFGLDSASVVVADSVFSDLGEEVDPAVLGNFTFSDSSNHILSSVNFDEVLQSPDLRTALNNLALQFEKQLETEENPEKRARLINYIRLCRSPEQFLARGLKYMSWAFFLLLPVFALILWLFYFRRNQYYIRHLIFSIHVHSFIFIIFILLTIIYMIFERNTGLISLILLFTIPVYLLLALKRFYGQGVGKLLLKFAGISVIYNFIFWAAVGLVFLNALNLI